MFEQIKAWDTSFFVWLNHQNHPWADIFMLWATGDTAWLPLYGLLIGFIVFYYQRKSWVVLVAIVLLITVADQFASGFLKPTVQRLRPCHEPELQNQIHLVVPNCGGTYGFVSSHAANTVALAVFLVGLARRKQQANAIARNYAKIFDIFLYSWALVVSYSRIYVGVHYPLDVLFGGLSGATWAVILLQTGKWKKLW